VELEGNFLLLITVTGILNIWLNGFVNFLFIELKVYANLIAHSVALYSGAVI
jgi:hypothetical protein